MGMFSNIFGHKKTLKLDRIKEFQAPTQGLIDEQLDIGRQLMDPTSAINMQQRQLMTQRAAETGAQTQRGLASTGAQMGMSPGQIMMQQRMGQNEAMGGVNQQFQGMLGNQFQSGLGLMGGMSQMQQGMDENMANAYVNQIAQANAARQQRFGNLMGFAGMAFGGAGSIMKGIGAMKEK